MKTTSNNQKQQKQSGQSLVEMAIMLVVLITILAGVLDLGRAYYVYLSLQDAAGEGATYGSIFPKRLAPNGDPRCQEGSACDNPHNVIYRAQHEAPSGGMIDWLNTDVDPVAPNITAGNKITVTVTYEYEVITPVIQVITGDTMTLRATAVNTIVGFSAP